MSIRFSCSCGKALKVSDDLAGKRVKCPNCGKPVVVPGPTGNEPLALELEAPAPEVSPAPAAPPAAEQPAPPVLEVGPGQTLAPPASEEVVELQEAAPLPPRPQPTEAAGEAYALASQPAAPASKNCPKCGQALPPGAVLCVNCGERLAGAPAGTVPRVAPRVKRKKKEEEGRGAGKAAPVGPAKIVAVAVLLAVAAGFGIYRLRSLLGPPRPPRAVGQREVAKRPSPQQRTGAKPAPAPAPAAPAGPAREAPQPARQPTPAAAAAPTVPPAGEWQGFADPTLAVRDRLVALGRALRERMASQGRPPSDVNELGLSADALADLTVIRVDLPAGAPFQPVAYASEPDAEGIQHTLFTDGTVRPVQAADLQRIIPRSDLNGLTPTDFALLSDLAPAVAVQNRRFPRVVVAIDGKDAGEVPHEGTRRFSLSPGNHRIEFITDKGRTGEIQIRAVAGLVHNYSFPRHQDCPAVPVRFYRSLISQRSETTLGSAPHPYEVEWKARTAARIVAPFETIIFEDDGSRGAVAADYGSIRARIERPGHVLMGPPGKPIGVSPLSRMQEGILRDDTGQEVAYTATPIGTLALSVTVNPRCMALARLNMPVRLASFGYGSTGRHRGAGMPPFSGEPAPFAPGAVQQPTPGLPPGAETGVAGRTARASVPARRWVVPDRSFTPQPAFERLDPAMRKMAAAITPHLMSQLRAIAQRATAETREVGGRTAAPGEGPMEPGRPVAPFARELPFGGRRMPPGVEIPPGPGMGGPEFEMEGEQRRVSRAGIDPALITGDLTPPSALPPPASPADVLAAVSAFADPAALPALHEIAGKIPSSDPAYEPLVVALARCGGTAALINVSAAAQDAPEAAAIAFTLINDPAAAKGLRQVVANWKADSVARAASAWLELAGPASRGLFITIVGETLPDLLDDPVALDALLRLDPFVTEQVLLRRFLAEGGPKKPEAPGAAGERPEGERPEGEPLDRGAPMDEFMRDREMLPRREGPLMPPEMEMFEGRTVEIKPYDAPLSWRVLARYRNTEAVRRLVALLGDSDPKRRRQALRALAETRDRNLEGPVLARIKDADAGTRSDAIYALLHVGGAESLAAAKEAIARDTMTEDLPDAVVAQADRIGRGLAAEILARMLTVSVEPAGAGEKKEGAEERQRGMPPRPGLLQVEKEPAKPMAVVVLDAIARLGASSQALDDAIGAALKDRNAATRAAAYRARAALGAPASAVAAGDPVRGLVKMFGRFASVRVALPVGSTAASQAALGDAEASVRSEGIRGLAGAAAETALPALQQAMKDSDWAVRRAAMETVATLVGAREGLASLIAQGLRDDDLRVVAAAAAAAERIGDRSLGKVVAEALNRPNLEGDDGNAAVVALAHAAGALRATEASGALQLLLAGSRPPAVRAAVARAVAEMRDPAVLPSLARLVDDAQPEVALAALNALADAGSRDAARGFVSLLQRQDLPPEERRALLGRFARMAARSQEFARLAASGPALSVADLRALAALAARSEPGDRAGYRVIAERYLARPAAESGASQGEQRTSTTTTSGTTTAKQTKESQDTPRRAAAFILASIPDDPEALKLLLDALRNDASGIGEPVAAAIRRIRDPGAVSMLQALYKELVESRKPGYTRYPGYAKAGQMENELLCRAIMEALAGIPGDEALEALRRATAYESRDDLKALFIDAYEKRGSPAAVACIAEFANRSQMYYEAVAESLGRVGHLNPEVAQKALQGIAQSPRSPVRAAAIAADALDALSIRLAATTQ